MIGRLFNLIFWGAIVALVFVVPGLVIAVAVVLFSLAYVFDWFGDKPVREPVKTVEEKPLSSAEIEKRHRDDMRALYYISALIVVALASTIAVADWMNIIEGAERGIMWLKVMAGFGAFAFFLAWVGVKDN